jgi:hypothetical protein
MVNIADSRTIVCSDFKDFLEYFKPTNPFEQFRDGYLCTIGARFDLGFEASEIHI